ncbi:hypothetical protein [Geosporobacter ferrireducens]|uniref:hypothetical protein n=1 Tax=Geosporobacter ferrireducens TaxID=1424294 RepID=UPI0012EA12C8|nr:hypothetical protein [Geosporobacter ferrireducens]MTI56915.1 hypothetical protein [Geosporobacter ferrireducens]
MKNAIKQEGLLDRVASMKFIDIFSPALSKYPEVFKQVSGGAAQVPIVAFGEEIISEGNVDITKIIENLKTR